MRRSTGHAIVVIILVVISAVIFLILLGPLSLNPGNGERGGTAQSQKDQNTIIIGNTTFNPDDLTIPVGSSVTWVNPLNSSNNNSIMSDDLVNGTFLFASSAIPPGQNYTFTFNEAGVFNYHSGVQYFLNGTIRVAFPNGTVPEGAKATPTGVASVEIENFQFTPAVLNVSRGTTVTWHNNGEMPHTVTIIDGPVRFNSGYFKPGESFSYTFTEAGTYNYMCSVHTFMFAKVVVS